MTEPITITHFTEENSQELWRLAALDDRRAPNAPALLAYVGRRAACRGRASRTAGPWPIRSIGPPSSWRFLQFQARREVAA